MRTRLLQVTRALIECIRLVSAGFDAADGDPLGDCKVSPAGFAHMTQMLSGLAGGKIVALLEVCVAVS